MANLGYSACRRIRRRAAASVLAVVVALQSGCVTVPVAPNTQHQGTPGRVAIVATMQEPEIKFQGFARGKGEGAAVGAGATLIQCLGAGMAGTCSGPYCGAVAVFWLGVCGVAGTVGGVVGATAAPSAGKARAAEARLTTALDTKTIQESLRDQVAAAALAKGTRLTAVSPASATDAVRQHGYGSLAAEGVDTVLEVALTKVGTEGPGINPPLQLRMEAHVRLIRTRDDAEVFSANCVYLGERLKLSEWSANQAEPLLRALQTGYETLGAHIYDNVFLLYPFPDREAHPAGALAPAFGLAPIDPHTRGTLTGDPFIGNRFEWTTVAGLQPTLRWQNFPRESDIQKAPEEMGRVKNVRYDLLIAREHNLAPAGIVYRREGLSESVHRVETPLNPRTRYFWTVRARFELDGRQRVTEWGATTFMARELWTAPSQWSYRFKTP